MSRIARLRRRTIATAGLLVAASAVGSIAGAAPSAHAAGLLPTSTTVKSSRYVFSYGTLVTFTATVNINVPVVNVGLGGALVAPSGKVAFYAFRDDNYLYPLGRASLPSGCLLTISPCSTSVSARNLPFGTVRVLARYEGDSLSKTSDSTIYVNVTE